MAHPKGTGRMDPLAAAAARPWELRGPAAGEGAAAEPGPSGAGLPELHEPALVGVPGGPSRRPSPRGLVLEAVELPAAHHARGGGVRRVHPDLRQRLAVLDRELAKRRRALLLRARETDPNPSLRLHCDSSEAAGGSQGRGRWWRTRCGRRRGRGRGDGGCGRRTGRWRSFWTRRRSTLSGWWPSSTPPATPNPTPPPPGGRPSSAPARGWTRRGPPGRRGSGRAGRRGRCTTGCWTPARRSG